MGAAAGFCAANQGEGRRHNVWPFPVLIDRNGSLGQGEGWRRHNV